MCSFGVESLESLLRKNPQTNGDRDPWTVTLNNAQFYIQNLCLDHDQRIKHPITLTIIKCNDLSDHAVPLSVYVLAMSAVGDQVEVISKADDLGQPLEDVDAETFAAVLHGVDPFQNHAVFEKKEILKVLFQIKQSPWEKREFADMRKRKRWWNVSTRITLGRENAGCCDQVAVWWHDASARLHLSAR